MTCANSFVPILTGPTGVGKTDVALRWAEACPTLEIVSVDSALIYRGMDIGTAKPSREILSQIPHHLIDIRDPAERYSVAEFCEDCRTAVADIFARGKQPLLVGGTMMYLNALRQGLANIPPVNETVAQAIAEMFEREGIAPLYARLQVKDPEGAGRLKPTDTQRILRALEVVESTGHPLHTYWESNQKPLPYPLRFFGVDVPDRAALHARIAQRTAQMLEMGLIEEVRRLFERGDLHPELPSIRSVGYRQVWGYFLGDFSQSQLQEKITISTRQLAKRQLTWLRSWADIQWISRTTNLEELCGELF